MLEKPLTAERPLVIALLLVLVGCGVSTSTRTTGSPVQPVSSDDLTTAPLQSLFTPEPSPSLAVDRIALELVEQRWGETNTLAMQAGALLLGMGPRVLLLDISNLSTPRIVGESAVLPGVVNALVVHDGIAYVGAGEHLIELEVRDPARITVLGDIRLEGAVPLSLLLEGNVLYVGGTRLVSSDPSLLSREQRGFLATVDISTPGDLQLLDTLDVQEPVPALALSNDILYAGPYLVEAGNPTKLGGPAEFSLSARYGISSFALFGNTLLVGGSFGIAGWDVSDPHAPREMFVIGEEEDITGEVRAMAAQANRLYLFHWYSEDMMYDAWVSALDISERFGDPPEYHASSAMILSGNHIFVADDGLRIYRAQNPVGEPVGQLETVLVQDVALAGAVGYIVSGGLRLRAGESRFISLSLLSLDQLGEYTHERVDARPSSLLTITLMGDLAYLNTWNDGIRIVSVSDPTRLRLVSSLDAEVFVSGSPFSAPPAAPAVEGHNAFLPLTDRMGFAVVDLSTPAAPRTWLISTEYPIFTIVPVTVGLVYAVGPDMDGQGDSLYLISGEENDWQVCCVAEFTTRILDVQPWNGGALVATEEGLTLVSSSGLTSLAVLNERRLPDGAYAVEQSGGVAFVTSVGNAGEGRLYAINLSDESLPVIASFDLPTGRAVVAAEEGWVLAGNQRMGLYALRVSR